jgi:hypothetical protein
LAATPVAAVRHPFVEQEFGFRQIQRPVDVRAIEVMVAHRPVVFVDDAVGNGPRVSRGDRRVKALVRRGRRAQIAQPLGDGRRVRER